MIFVDTNYFLRFFLGDVKKQHEEARELFLSASDGGVRLFTSLVVVFEVYWVILSQFKKNKEKTSQVLEKFFRLQFIEIEGIDLLEKALKIYKKANLGFVDCYNLVYAREMKASDFKTFDKKLLRKLFVIENGNPKNNLPG